MENIINFKAMGYVKTFTIPEMISSCENNSHKLVQVQNDELRRIKDNYAKGPLKPEEKAYLDRLYLENVLTNRKETKKPTLQAHHIGLQMLNAMNV